MSYLPRSLYQFIESEDRLKYTLQGRRRVDPQLQVKAAGIMRCQLDGEKAEEENKGGYSTHAIFEYSHLKEFLREISILTKVRRRSVALRLHNAFPVLTSSAD